MAKKRDDYDSPWKKAISLYFPEFMNFFFPQIYSQIDWEKGYEFLDTELQQIVREAEIGAREADKLVKVWQLNGEETWVLIHLEVQSQVQSEFAERMYVYSNRIFDLYRRKVVSLAVLADDQPSWRPSEYAYEIWGCQVLLRFPTIKLLDYSSAMLEDLRYQEKLKIAKSLYRRGYSRQDILELFALLDWMMRLPPEIEQGFKQEIRYYEEDNQMPTVFTIESMAKMETTQQKILEILEIRFDSVSKEWSEAIKKIYDPEQLDLLFRQAVTIESLAEFQNLVEQVQANLEPYIFD